MNTTAPPDALPPVFVDLPTFTDSGSVMPVTHLNTGFITTQEEKKAWSFPGKHGAARFFDRNGATMIIALICADIFTGSAWLGPTYMGLATGGFRVASVLIMAAIVILAVVFVASARTVDRDGRDFAWTVAAATKIPAMVRRENLPSSVLQLAKDLEASRTQAAKLNATPAIEGAYTTALTALAEAATQYNAITDEGIAAERAFHLHRNPAVKALAKKTRATAKAGVAAESAAKAAIKTFARTVADARVLAAATR